MRMSLRTQRFSGHEWSHHMRSRKQDTATHCQWAGSLALFAGIVLSTKCVPLNLYRFNVHGRILSLPLGGSTHHILDRGNMKEAHEHLLLEGIFVVWGPQENQPPQQLAWKRSRVPCR